MLHIHSQVDQEEKQPHGEICVYDTGMDAGVSTRTMWVVRLCLFLDSLTLKTTALRSFETSGTKSSRTQCEIPEDLSFRVKRHVKNTIYAAQKSYCSGLFAKLRKATISFVISARSSICPHGTTRSPLEGFL